MQQICLPVCAFWPVDDMKVNLMLIMKLLKKHGCEVMSAENGRQAVEMMKTEHYDIVFMDCQMPEMDGFEATSHIRQPEGETRHTIIVALTADAMTGDREKCLNAGMDDYLNKLSSGFQANRNTSEMAWF